MASIKGILNFIATNIKFGFNVENKEAIRYFESKGLQPSFSYADMQRDEHNKALTVAKMLDMDMLQDVHDSLGLALKKGWTYQEWSDRIIPILQANGWWGRKTVVDPVTGKTIIAQLGSPHRLKTIFRTNMQQAYSIGRWQQVMETASARPYLRYDAIDDHRTRSEHRRWNGTILPFDHPFWRTHYPPCGYNCFLPDVNIDGASLGAIKRFYDGQIVELITQSGRKLRITANHPILTAKGWIVANLIKNGDDLLAYNRPVESTHINSLPREVNDDQFKVTAENLFKSFIGHAFAISKASSFEFDSDILTNDGQVHIDIMDNSLFFSIYSKREQIFSQNILVSRYDGCTDTSTKANSLSKRPSVVPDVIFSKNSVNVTGRCVENGCNFSLANVLRLIESKGCNFQVSISIPSGLPSSRTLPFDTTSSLFNFLPLDRFGLASSSQDNALFNELSSNGRATDIGLFGYLIDTHTSQVFSDPVVDVVHSTFSGHVYDFQSDSGLLSANGIITHNCRCSVTQFSQADLEAKGYQISDKPDLSTDGIDKGFDYNAGADHTSHLQDVARGKVDKIKDVELKKAANEALNDIEKQIKPDVSIAKPVKPIVPTKVDVVKDIPRPAITIEKPEIKPISQVNENPIKEVGAALTLGEQKGIINNWISSTELRNISYELGSSAIEKKANALGLTFPEQVALRHYTGNGFGDLNQHLLGAALDDGLLNKSADLLNQALEKLPNYTGKAVRRTFLPDNVLALHQEGNIVTYEAFTSATYGKKDIFEQKPHRLVIKSKTGKKIDWISKYKGKEFEVLFGRPKRFLVKKRRELDGGVVEIELWEIGE